MAYGYQGITINGRFAVLSDIDADTTLIHLSGSGGPADITFGMDDGTPFVEVEARNDAFDYDFHEKLVAKPEREVIPGGVILRFETVKRQKGTAVVYENGLSKNTFSVEVF